MATGLATRNGTHQAPMTLGPVEAALVNGDLERLAPEQRLAYYQKRCEAAGLNPITRPFDYLKLSGKLVLYANKSCTDQLAGIHGLSPRILARETVGDVHVATVEVSSPTGRACQDIGAVVIGGKRGEDLANSFMKAVTKAKRRAILSFCGLGDVIDETELDTCRSVQHCTPDGEVLPDAHHAKNFTANNSGHGSGAYAKPEDVKAYVEWAKAYAENVNVKWLDYLTDKVGIDRAKDLVSEFQILGHLYKWGRSEGLFNAPEETRPGSRDKYAAIAWVAERDAVEVETRRYCKEQWHKAAATLPGREEEEDQSAGEGGEVADQPLPREPECDDE